MTVISASSRRRKSDFGPSGSGNSARLLFLAVACVWPLAVFLLFGWSSPHLDAETSKSLVSSAASVGKNLRFNFRNVVDRVDIMGYGPTHPRVAAVIVGTDAENIVTSVDSLFRHTDMNRIFVVAVVVDGHAHDKELVKKLQRIDDGAIPHWHGLRPDIHQTTKGDNDAADQEDEPHGHKVHVIFNPTKVGVTESRADAVEFVRILQKHHEDVGLKTQEEDLILLLMQGGAQLTARSWLDPVTEALIVPPPILSQQEDSSTVALKIANAVSFNLEGPAKKTGFDSTFTPIVSDASAADINPSSGASYPAPALNGAAVAMRLDTYVNLPLQDLSLTDIWTANLDLSLNLWLCADGIDMIRGVEVTSLEQRHSAPLEPAMAARFAAAWMDEVTAKKFYNAYSRSNSDLTWLEWQTFMSDARDSPTFTADLATRCRSFTWYAQEINPDLADFLAESEQIEEKVTVADEPPAVKVTAEVPVAAAAEEVASAAKIPDSADDVSIPNRDDRPKPSKPLCDECLKIVQKAKPVDITYVDVAGEHKEHPHMGATDENGNLGYIHDETALRKNPPPFAFEGEALRNACLRRDNNYKMLKERVFVDFEADAVAQQSGKKRATVFCLVYTIEQNHPSIPRIRETWG
jgi:hypothetical protein